MLEGVWRSTRRFLPLRVYPLLAPIHRWRRRGRIRRLKIADQRYLAEHPGLRVPPAELRYNVVGARTIEQFLEGGEQTVDDIERALRSVGQSLENSARFLDFGCGCGRLILALRKRKLPLQITGCDVDARAIDWCLQNLAPVRFVVGQELPPSQFEAGAFDLVWAGSVFSHLDEERQDRWLGEMRRILKPGGFLLASLHGVHCWEPRASAWAVTELKRRGMLFVKTGIDSGIHPDWYQVAWHTEAYIREHWGAMLEICDYLPQGFNGFQDIVVAQKRE